MIKDRVVQYGLYKYAVDMQFEDTDSNGEKEYFYYRTNMQAKVARRGATCEWVVSFLGVLCFCFICL